MDKTMNLQQHNSPDVEWTGAVIDKQFIIKYTNYIHSMYAQLVNKHTTQNAAQNSIKS